MQEPTSTMCGHTFCYTCIVKKSGVCVFCPKKTAAVCPNYTWKLVADCLSSHCPVQSFWTSLLYKKKHKTVIPIPDSDVECAICKESPVYKPTMTSCGHTFCESCITIYKKNYSNKCPICRKTIVSTAPNYILLCFLQKLPAYDRIESRKRELASVWGPVELYKSSLKEEMQLYILDLLLQCPLPGIKSYFRDDTTVMWCVPPFLSKGIKLILALDWGYHFFFLYTPKLFIFVKINVP